MRDFLLQALHNNQFTSGGLVLLIVGGIGAYLRKVPEAIYNFILNQITLDLTITDQCDGFQYFMCWFTSSDLSKNVRRVDFGTTIINGHHKIIFKLAPGAKWIWYKKRPCRVSFTRKENDGPGSSSEKRTESIHIWTFGRNRKFIELMCSEMKTVYIKANAHSPAMNLYRRDYWSNSWSFRTRQLETVVLPEYVKEDLVNDISNFRKNEQWYKSMGIPYHRGYLLHGMPGTGKTSVVTALASYFNVDIYYLKLNEMNDRMLNEAVTRIQANSIILLEDVDCVVPQRKVKDQSKADTEDYNVSLSGLLNVLDGMQSPYGGMFFLTSNDISNLDTALLRPGRIDKRIHFEEATREQKEQMFKRFFPRATPSEELLTNHGVKTMAEFQQVLMEEKEQKTYEYYPDKQAWDVDDPRKASSTSN